MVFCLMCMCIHTCVVHVMYMCVNGAVMRRWCAYCGVNWICEEESKYENTGVGRKI